MLTEQVWCIFTSKFQNALCRCSGKSQQGLPVPAETGLCTHDWQSLIAKEEAMQITADWFLQINYAWKTTRFYLLLQNSCLAVQTPGLEVDVALNVTLAVSQPLRPPPMLIPCSPSLGPWHFAAALSGSPFLTLMSLPKLQARSRSHRLCFQPTHAAHGSHRPTDEKLGKNTNDTFLSHEKKLRQKEQSLKWQKMCR